ncbi:MAG: efflux RND transporter permease subunit [Sphingomonadales bacterium]
MWSRVASFILRNRLFILAIIGIVTVFFGYYAVTSLKVDNRFGNTLPKDDPIQMDYENFKLQFGEDGSTLVIAVQTDSLYTEENLKKWRELGYKILKFKGVDNVVSEATLFGMTNNIAKNEFEIHRIFSDTTFRDKSIEEVRKEIRKNPIYRGLLYNDTSNVSLLMIGIDEKVLSNPKKSGVVLQIEELANQYEKHFGKVYFAGLPHIRVVVGKRIVAEMYIFLALSILASSLLLFIFFRSLYVVFLCNTVVFISVIWALGSIAFMGFELSIIMALIPPLLIVIGVPNCVFLITRYHQEYVRLDNKMRALFVMIKRIGSVTFLTNLTTAVGFVTFTSSDKLAQFGIISSWNIMVVFVLSLAIIPIFASFAKPPKPRHLKHLSRVYSQGFIEIIVKIVTKYRPWIYASSIFLVIFSLYGMTKIISTGNVTSDIPKDDPILLDLKFVEHHFGGSIPFEITINYKEKGRLFNIETMRKVESIQQLFATDTLFSKSISYVDLIKSINMAYHRGDPSKFTLISNRDKLRLKKYIDKLDLSSLNGGAVSLKSLVDTTNTTLRIRMQMKDLSIDKVGPTLDALKIKTENILNPDKATLERLYSNIVKGSAGAMDSLIYEHTGVFNTLTALVSNGNDQKQLAFDMNPDKIKSYMGTARFNKNLKKAIEAESYDLVFTGIKVVQTEGTKYLFVNLLQSLIFAVISIAIMMAFLFRSFRIILVSMIPNIIPLLFTAGIMGYFQIPLKPSTILVFGIALGITVDNAILFLGKYRNELKQHGWDVRFAILHSLRETGLGIFYTSVILFFGFLMFVFSQFGGTKALGLLVSITIMVGMATNLIILPALLLTLERKYSTRSFQEPFFDIYNEETDYDVDKLEIEFAQQEEK